VPRSRLRPPARNRRSAHRRETRGCHRTRVAIARRRYPPTPGQGSASVHAIWRRWAPRRRGGSAVRYCSCTLRDSASHSRRFGGSRASRPRRRGVGLRVLATEERRARGDAVPDRVVDLVGPGRRATGPESDERSRHGTGLPWSAAERAHDSSRWRGRSRGHRANGP
jgi:hypothetical protein